MNIRYMVLMVCLMFTGGLVYGAPWGLLKDMEPGISPEVQKEIQAPFYNLVLLSKIVKNNSIRVFLQVPGVDQEEYEEYRTLTVDNYNTWFSAAVKLINEQKRRQEFADVLPVLTKGVKLKFVSQKNEADVAIYVLPVEEARKKCSLSAACFLLPSSERKIPQIIIPQHDWIEKLITWGKVDPVRMELHEIGHSLGLSDQYFYVANQSSHPMYSSVRPGDGLMNRASKITCDEVDGLINLIDLVRGTSRGGTKGWKSLCPTSQERYSNGRSLARGPFVITISDDNVFTMEIYKKGEKFAHYTYPLENQKNFAQEILTAETVLFKDGIGRPLITAGSAGEKIYYSYFYDNYNRLAIRKGRLLWAEKNYKQWWGKEESQETELYFKRQGKVSKAMMSEISFNRTVISYKEEKIPGQIAFRLYLQIKNGEITQERWEEESVPPEVGAEDNEFNSTPKTQLGEQIQTQVKEKYKTTQKAQIKKLMLQWYSQHHQTQENSWF